MFQQFKNATRAEAPQILAAEIADAEAKANARALRNKTAMDAGMMYNVGMGDNSPIYDSMFGAEAAGIPAGSASASGSPIGWSAMAPTTQTAATVAPSGGEALLAETMAGASGAGGAAGGEALAAEALGSGALSTGAGTAGAAGGGGSAALAAGGPYAAALAAALYADDQLLDGQGLDANMDALGALYGKGWLWS